MTAVPIAVELCEVPAPSKHHRDSIHSVPDTPKSDAAASTAPSSEVAMLSDKERVLKVDDDEEEEEESVVVMTMPNSESRVPCASEEPSVYSSNEESHHSE